MATYANWVAKTASLFVEEYDLERGQRIRLDLPVHWLGPVLLGAAWSVGLVVTQDDDADLVVCGPDTVAAWGTQRVVRGGGMYTMGNAKQGAEARPVRKKQHTL